MKANLRSAPWSDPETLTVGSDILAHLPELTSTEFGLAVWDAVKGIGSRDLIGVFDMDRRDCAFIDRQTFLADPATKPVQEAMEAMLPDTWARLGTPASSYPPFPEPEQVSLWLVLYGSPKEIDVQGAVCRVMVSPIESIKTSAPRPPASAPN